MYGACGNTIYELRWIEPPRGIRSAKALQKAILQVVVAVSNFGGSIIYE